MILGDYWGSPTQDSNDAHGHPSELGIKGSCTNLLARQTYNNTRNHQPLSQKSTDLPQVPSMKLLFRIFPSKTAEFQTQQPKIHIKGTVGYYKSLRYNISIYITSFHIVKKIFRLSYCWRKKRKIYTNSLNTPYYNFENFDNETPKGV